MSFRSSLSLEERCDVEERLIRWYGAARRRRQSSRPITEPQPAAEGSSKIHVTEANRILAQGHGEDLLLLLDGMPRADRGIASHVPWSSQTRALDTESLMRMNHLQASLSGFVMESVERLPEVAPDRTTALDSHGPTRETYLLQGFFLDDPSLGAVVRMELVAPPPSVATQARSIPEPIPSASDPQQDVHVSDLDFGLERRQGARPRREEPLEPMDPHWLQQQVVASNTADPRNLSTWVQRVKRFLRFCREREAFLQQHERYFTRMAQEHSKLTVEMRLHEPSEDSETGATLTFQWDYSWRQQTDTLRLLESQGRTWQSMHRNGLSQLVRMTGSCCDALRLLLPHPADGDEEASREWRRAKRQRRQTGDDSSHEDADDEGQDATSSSDIEEARDGRVLSEYEKQRLKRIKRNEAYFASLGLLEVKESMMRASRHRKRQRRK